MCLGGLCGNLLLGANVVVHALDTFEVLEENVHLVGVVKVRVAFPLDVEALEVEKESGAGRGSQAGLTHNISVKVVLRIFLPFFISVVVEDSLDFMHLLLWTSRDMSNAVDVHHVVIVAAGVLLIIVVFCIVGDAVSATTEAEILVGSSHAFLFP
jgi:hypothetical protein